MDDKKRAFVKALSDHAEDIALFGGALLLSVGMALQFGAPVGMTVAGFLAIAYGVWIGRAT